MEKKLYRKALDLLARRGQTRAQLRRKLLARGSAAAVEEILDALQAGGYLNDQELAYNRALAKRNRRHWGDLRIARDLGRLGVDVTIVERVLEQVNNEKEEGESLREAIQMWIDRRGQPEDPVRLKKLFDHCLRLGYPGDRVRSRLEPYFEGVDWSNTKPL